MYIVTFFALCGSKDSYKRNLILKTGNAYGILVIKYASDIF